MKRHGPVLTLLAVALFMAGMLAVNMTKAKRITGFPAAYPVAASGTSTPTASASATTAVSTSASSTPTAGVSASSIHPVASGFPTAAAYTGWTAGHEASIAIAVKGNRALAYLCDGKQVESWLRGKAVGGLVTLSGKSGDALTARLMTHTVSGVVSVRGRRLSFSAQLTTPPGGLYTATVAATQARLTWIVRTDGGQTGLQLSNGRGAPAPELDPTNRLARVNGTTVRAAAVAGDFPPPS